jgi:methionyl-tRNA synthetase
MIKFFTQYPWVLMIILIWSLPWKGAALWRSARRSHLGWFIALLVVNTLGILDIIYIFIISDWKKDRIEEEIAMEMELRAYPRRKLM